MSKHILVVEDSSTMRSLIASTLELLEDIEITESPSGFEALKVLPHKKFDLILTDINMPDINGLELVSFIKNNQEYKSVPLIIVSTEGSAKDVERGMALGADEYVTKPFSAEELQSVVKKYLYK